MKLYKRDTQTCTVREVEGEPCYRNSHFPSEAEAWSSLKAEVEAKVAMAGRDVAQKETGTAKGARGGW